MRKSTGFLIALVAAAISLQSAASTLYLSSDRLIQADLVNKKHVLIGNPGVGPIPELASDWREQSFRIWTVTHSSSGSTLRRLDPATAQVIASTPAIYPTDPFLRGLAFDPKTETLFATGGSTSNQLLKVDPATGVVQLIGNIGNTYIVDGLAVDPSGNLWGTASDSRLGVDDEVLLKLNPTNAAVLSQVKFSPGSSAPTDIAFRPEDGQLFGASSAVAANVSLSTIDPATGAITVINMSNTQGTTGGIAFGPVPEPSSLWLAVAASLLVTRRPRRA